MQNYVNCEDAIIAPLIFYSDQTNLSSNMRVNGYPLIMTLANISNERRQAPEGRVLLALLPILPSDASMYILQCTFDFDLS
jgi:hypothetical protein